MPDAIAEWCSACAGKGTVRDYDENGADRGLRPCPACALCQNLAKNAPPDLRRLLAEYRMTLHAPGTGEPHTRDHSWSAYARGRYTPGEWGYGATADLAVRDAVRRTRELDDATPAELRSGA